MHQLLSLSCLLLTEHLVTLRPAAQRRNHVPSLSQERRVADDIAGRKKWVVDIDAGVTQARSWRRGKVEQMVLSQSERGGEGMRKAVEEYNLHLAHTFQINTLPWKEMLTTCTELSDSSLG